MTHLVDAAEMCGREMLMRLRFVVWEPKWMRENQVQKDISYRR